MYLCFLQWTCVIFCLLGNCRWNNGHRSIQKQEKQDPGKYTSPLQGRASYSSINSLTSVICWLLSELALFLTKCISVAIWTKQINMILPNLSCAISELALPTDFFFVLLLFSHISWSSLINSTFYLHLGNNVKKYILLPCCLCSSGSCWFSAS